MNCKENSKIILPKKPIPAIPVSHPQISPDGRNILFTYAKVNEEDAKYESHIWIAPTRGGEPKQFTYGDGSDSNPRWSPDGRNVIFLSNRGGAGDKEKKMQIWIMPACGGEARQLTSVPNGVVGAPWPLSWSPDGERILFLSRTKTVEEEEDDGEKKSDLIVIRKLNHKLNGVGYFPDTRLHLYTVDINGVELNQLTKGEFDVVYADWSPDGKEIAFVANMAEDADYSSLKDIWSISSEGGNPKRLVRGKVDIMSLSWSPDGKHIAFTCRSSEKKYTYTNLWIVSPEDGETKNLTESFDREIMRMIAPIWTPNSKAVYFASDDGGCRHIYGVTLDTSEVERVTEGMMMIQGLSLNEDGSKIAFVATEATRLPEVWIYEGGEAERITKFSDGLLRGMELIEPQEFKFMASDGVEVEGWVMRPVGLKEGERYPTILNIHGGPWGDYGYSFDLRFQVLAANGYAVVFINHRASPGYGEAFADITGHWGEREYEDLMEAMDFVVERYPFVDGDRLGVTGCSGGGYLTNWIVTHTTRFKAAVAVASISNWYSMYGCSDLGPCHILPLHEIGRGKDPWNAEEAYFEKSPIRYVENVETPLLIIHGENDLRCPMEQAEQLFIALKKLRKEVEFIRLPGEPHARITGFKKPSHTTEAFRHTLRWFNKYLK